MRLQCIGCMRKNLPQVPDSTARESKDRKVPGRIVVTPTETWIREAVQRCETRFVAASPFVTSMFEQILAGLRDNIERILITRVNLKDLAVGASEHEAICAIARAGISVRSLPKLHAKVYIVDSKCALVTSANATAAGLRHNLECGISIEEASLVARLTEIVLAGFGCAEEPIPWQQDELEELREPLKLIRETVYTMPAKQVADLERMTIAIENRNKQRQLLSSFGGWTSLVLEAVFRQPGEVFSLDELLATSRPMASRKYPDNRHVRAKIRQQLQRLRDMGLVEFRGGGTYRRLITQKER